MSDNERPMTLEEAAALLRMATSSLRRRVHRGEVVARKVGGSGRLLFRREDLDSALQPVKEEIKE